MNGQLDLFKSPVLMHPWYELMVVLEKQYPPVTMETRMKRRICKLWFLTIPEMTRIIHKTVDMHIQALCFFSSLSKLHFCMLVEYKRLARSLGTRFSI